MEEEKKKEIQNICADYLKNKRTALEKDAKDMFVRADPDNTGYLDKSGVKKILEELVEFTESEEEVTDEMADKKLKEFDSNKDGKLSFDEFLVYVIKSYEKMAKGDFSI